MNKLCWLVFSLAISTLGLLSQASDVDQLREWKWLDGTTVRAELTEYDGSTAKLRLENGGSLEVQDSHLSPSGQAKLARFLMTERLRSNLSTPSNHRFY
ncbi:MAG: hypothetical protein AAF733_00140 [Verrucomicrobiota bacterium]